MSELSWQDPADWSTETTDGAFYAEERNGWWHLWARKDYLGKFRSKQEAQSNAEGAQ